MDTMQEQNLFSVPITAQIDESSTNISDWKQQNFVYCSQVSPEICTSAAAKMSSWPK